MRIRLAPVLLTTALLGAGVFAFVRMDPGAPAISSEPPPAAAAGNDQSGAPATNAPGAAGSMQMPPNHPPVAGMAGHGMHGMGSAAPGMGGPAPAPEPAAITWKAPDVWKTAPNPNPMRIATMHVPAAGGAPDEAELAVSRAGGSIEANVSRWRGQFEEPSADQREEKTVSGFKVTIVTLGGTYTGAMTGTPESHQSWQMLAAIVETPGQPYFFKLTGPEASVKAARPKFDALIASIKPAS